MSEGRIARLEEHRTNEGVKSQERVACLGKSSMVLDRSNRSCSQTDVLEPYGDAQP